MAKSRACALAIAVLFCVPIDGAQSADPYLQLLRVYRDQPAVAAQSATKLSADATRDGLQLCRAERCSLQQIRAAAMLHADAADLLIGPVGYAARDQIGFGRQLLQIARNIVGASATFASERSELETFGGRWYALTARLLLAHGHFEVASLLVTEGRVNYPKSPDLYVVLGLLNEWRGGLGLLAADRRVWDDLPPEFIGRTNPEARYLAHLLRGTAAEREKNAASALAEYEAARLTNPHSQTACLAVSSAQALNEKLSEPRATAVECLHPVHERPDVDAWTVFRLGLMDLTTTEAMRDEARRQ